MVPVCIISQTPLSSLLHDHQQQSAVFHQHALLYYLFRPVLYNFNVSTASFRTVAVLLTYTQAVKVESVKSLCTIQRHRSWKNGGTTPVLLNHGTRLTRVYSFTTQLLYSGRKGSAYSWVTGWVWRNWSGSGGTGVGLEELEWV